MMFETRQHLKATFLLFAFLGANFGMFTPEAFSEISKRQWNSGNVNTKPLTVEVRNESELAGQALDKINAQPSHHQQTSRVQ